MPVSLLLVAAARFPLLTVSRALFCIAWAALKCRAAWHSCEAVLRPRWPSSRPCQNWGWPAIDGLNDPQKGAHPTATAGAVGGGPPRKIRRVLRRDRSSS